MATTHLNNRRGGSASRSNSNHSDVDVEGASFRRLDGPLELEPSMSTSDNNISDHHDCDRDRPHVPPVAITSVPWAREAAPSVLSASPPHSHAGQEEINAACSLDIIDLASEAAVAVGRNDEVADSSSEDAGSDVDDDMRGLLADELASTSNPSKPTTTTGANTRGGGDAAARSNTHTLERQSTPSTYCRCLRLPCEKVGHCTVFLPKVYRRTNEWFGIVGPHWYGTLCTLALLWGAGGHFTYKAFGQALYKLQDLNQQESTDTEDGSPLGWKELAMVWFKPTFCMCCLFYGTIYLALTCCVNPGIVTETNNGYAQQQESLAQETAEASESGNGSRRRRRRPPFRWCDICRVHQPHHAVHCPDCNVCIAHYDHHCPWMGTCIGGSNMKPFVRFNLSWFLFLAYVMAFVAFADPPITRASGSSASGGALNATENGHAPEKNVTHVVFGHGGSP